MKKSWKNVFQFILHTSKNHILLETCNLISLNGSNDKQQKVAFFLLNQITAMVNIT
jgi:hypothetical protein